MKIRVVVGVIISLALLNLAGLNLLWQKYQPTAETLSLTLEPDSLDLQPLASIEITPSATPENISNESSIPVAALSETETVDEDFDGMDDRWEFMWWGCYQPNDPSQTIWTVDQQWYFDDLSNWEDWTVSHNSTVGQSWKTKCGTRSVIVSGGAIAIPDTIVTDLHNGIGDSDNDDCLNLCEENNNTQPLDFGADLGTDTDGDGLSDGDEVHDYDTNPTGGDFFYCDDSEQFNGADGVPDGYDTDCDGVPDGVEVGVLEPNNPSFIYPGKEAPYSDPPIVGYPYRPSHPLQVDSDGDGLTDHQEYYDDTPCSGSEMVGRPLAATPYECHPNLTRTVSYPTNQYFTNPTYYDDTGDAIDDGFDTDNDGLNDDEEINGFVRVFILNGIPSALTYYPHPNYADSDNDGLSDAQEVMTLVYGGYTNPQNVDTDGDTVSDYDELTVYNANPLDADGDFDNLSDYVEVNLIFEYPTRDYASNSHPNDPNTDGDGGADMDRDGYPDAATPATNELLPGESLIYPDACRNMNDGYEVYTLGTDPTSLDSDEDGLSDCYELDANLNPTDPDTDDDGYLDGDEVGAGSSPYDPTSTPDSSSDSDMDALPDWWELANFGNLSQSPTGDSDGDGCNNLCEYQRGTDPNDTDTDNDGLLDNNELPDSSPTNPDTDGDGLNDYQEANYVFNGVPHPLNRRNVDTDGDGISDYNEVHIYSTNAATNDTDGDNLPDKLELFPSAFPASFPPQYLYIANPTNPLSADSDGDTLTDYEEIFVYYNSGVNPNVPDTDDDELNDAVELEQSVSNPNDSDTDDDGLTDGAEYNGLMMTINFCAASGGSQIINLNQLNLNMLDTDADGLSDGAEVTIHGTNPQDFDTDDDGIPDNIEVSTGDDALCGGFFAPSNAVATTTGYRSINITWQDGSASATSFQVEYSLTGNDNWTLLASVAPGVESVNHNGLFCNHTYYYRVRGHRNSDDAFTDYTPVFSATLTCPVLSAPQPPTVSGVIQRTVLSIRVAADSSGEIQTLYLEQQNVSEISPSWQQVTSFSATGGTYTANSLTCETTYKFRVRGYRVDDNSYSPYSTELSVTTAPCQTLAANTVGLYRHGVWLFQTIGTETTITIRFGSQEGGWTPIVGNWTGSGVDGLGLYRNGLFILRNATTTGAVDNVYQFGPQEGGWQPLVGDWNGDGVETVGVFKAGLFLLTNSANGASVDYRFRLGTDANIRQVIVGDWNNDGTDSVGLYRDGYFYLTNALDGSGLRRPFTFGPTTANWIPLAGDWDANGTTSIGVYRDSVWRLRNTNNTGLVDIGFNFGPRESGWQPIASYQGSATVLAALALHTDNSAFAEAAIAPIATEAPQAIVETEIAPTATAEITVEVTPEITVEASPETIITPEPTLEPVETEVTTEPVPIITETVAPTPEPETTLEAPETTVEPQSE